MDTRVLIVSVPHAGTRTLQAIFPRSQSTHTINEISQLIKTLNRPGLLLVPLRDPQAVWNSWTKRVGTKDEIKLNRFVPAWKTLAKTDQLFDLISVPVDLAGIRDRELSKIADVSWDWSNRVGHEAELAEQPLNMPSKDEIYSLPIVRKFYTTF